MAGAFPEGMENKPHILPGSLLVGMVREKSPGIASGSRFLQQFAKPFETIFRDLYRL
jgi:hypothetical protein